jgi:hypothetical protein
MISNTTQDLELIQLQSGLSAAQANITSLGAVLTLTSAGTLISLGGYFLQFWRCIS